MRGVYEANYDASAVTTAHTLLWFTTTASIGVEILEASVTDQNNTTNQQFECAFQRITTVGSAAGTALTPSKSESGDQAAASTVTANLTVEPTTYTANTSFGDESAASLGGWRFQPIPENRFYIPPSANAGLRLLTAVTNMNITIRCSFREFL